AAPSVGLATARISGSPRQFLVPIVAPGYRAAALAFAVSIGSVVFVVCGTALRQSLPDKRNPAICGAFSTGHPGLEPGIAGFGDRCLSQFGQCPSAGNRSPRGPGL